MISLFLIRVPVAVHGLARWAGERGWIRRRHREVGFDEGRALHHLVDEVFGPAALRPFRLLVAPRGARGNLYGYCENAGEDLQAAGRTHALPEHLSVLNIDRLEGKVMPTAWKAGQRIGFDLRARPVRRLKNDLATDKGTFRAGAELDAFCIEAFRRHPDDDKGMVKEARSREAVYFDWLAERLAPVAELDHGATRLVHFQRTRIARGHTGPEGPDATFHGALTVHDPAGFSDMLARGVGRHRAYGYGMLLLRPASRPVPRH